MDDADQPSLQDQWKAVIRRISPLLQVIVSLLTVIGVCWAAITGIFTYWRWDFFIPAASLTALMFSMAWILWHEPSPKSNQDRQRSRLALLISGTLAVSLYLTMQAVGPYERLAVARPDAWSLITQYSWLDFVPAGYSP